RYKGVEYRLWSNDHDPPHVHVRPAQTHPDWEIIVFLGNEKDGSSDAHGREFGDTKIVTGRIRTSKLNDLVTHLSQRRNEAWTKWREING
ncbi:MAG: DUF4160 domain-containing protein, partial [Phormidesmis sp.]